MNEKMWATCISKMPDFYIHTEKKTQRERASINQFSFFLHFIIAYDLLSNIGLPPPLIHPTELNPNTFNGSATNLPYCLNCNIKRVLKHLSSVFKQQNLCI